MRYLVKVNNWYITGTDPFRIARHRSRAMSFSAQRRDEIVELLKLQFKGATIETEEVNV